jgi:hypothetical protein
LEKIKKKVRMSIQIKCRIRINITRGKEGVGRRPEQLGR